MCLRSLMFAVCVSAVSSVVFSGVSSEDEKVAAGFPIWQGVSERNYVMGREICPSDLRHKATVVFELEPNDKLQKSFLEIGEILSLDPLTVSNFGENWETRILSRDVIFLISIRGERKKDFDAFLASALKAPKDSPEYTRTLLSRIGGANAPVYFNVTMNGGPDTTGKRPYVYALGPVGKELIYEGALNGLETLRTLRGVIGKAKESMARFANPWRPFFGSLAEEDYPRALVKALEKGKTAKTSSLVPVEQGLLKDVVAADDAKAASSQIAYDALEQTRSDLVMRIKMECRECPHRAVYDLQQLLKFWPGEKKRLETIAAKLKADPDATKLSQIFCKTIVWADPEFVCKNVGEAKKIVLELGKMKKVLGKLKESANIAVQNGAILLDAQIDELMTTVPSKMLVK